MKQSAILGPNGRPLSKAALADEVVTTSLTGIRRPWLVEHIAGNIDPVRLANLMQAAAEGNAFDFLTLAEEMEEREPHYGSVLGTRKRAVSGIAPVIETASEDSRDIKQAEACRALIGRPEFGGLMDDCLDALGKGYAAVEIEWQTSARQYQPVNYRWRDPRYFVFPQDDPYDLRLYDESDLVNGRPLPAYKFVIHRPRLKSGIPLRGGLARLVATSYMCKSYTLKDWVAFCEVFGMPLRLGRYKQGAKEADIDILRKAVTNLGSDAAGILPDSMRIEFQQIANTTGGTDLFLRLAEWLDRQTSKAVLGQTMTTDDGSSQAQATVHNEVRHDILKSDARQLANTLNRDLIQPYVDLNFGPQAQYPRLELRAPKPEDLKALAESLEKLVPLGLKVSASVVRDKFGLPDPKEGDELLKSPHQPVPARNREIALNREAPEEMDDLVDEFTADWQPQLQPVRDVEQLLSRMAAEGKSLEEFRRALMGLAGNDDRTLTERLTDAAFRARAVGDADP